MVYEKHLWLFYVSIYTIYLKIKTLFECIKENIEYLFARNNSCVNSTQKDIFTSNAESNKISKMLLI